MKLSTKIFFINSLWPSDVIWRQGSRSTLPDGTKPLPESMLTNDQWDVVALTWQQFHRKCSRHLSLKWVWNLLIWDCSQIPQGPMRWLCQVPYYCKTFNIRHTKSQSSCLPYRDFHYKDKTVSGPSNLYNGNSHGWKDRLCIDGPKNVPTVFSDDTGTATVKVRCQWDHLIFTKGFADAAKMTSL